MPLAVDSHVASTQAEDTVNYTVAFPIVELDNSSFLSHQFLQNIAKK